MLKGRKGKYRPKPGAGGLNSSSDVSFSTGNPSGLSSTNSSNRTSKQYSAEFSSYNSSAITSKQFSDATSNQFSQGNKTSDSRKHMRDSYPGRHIASYSEDGRFWNDGDESSIGGLPQVPASDINWSFGGALPKIPAIQSLQIPTTMESSSPTMESSSIYSHTPHFIPTIASPTGTFQSSAGKLCPQQERCSLLRVSYVLNRNVAVFRG